MSELKIFAGPRVRRIRNGLGVTQTAMAQALGISPSYLNLIERNQRPLTVQLVMKLASVYKVDVEELRSESGSITGELRDVFSDPLLTGEIPGTEELIEVAEAAPNAAQGMIKLYRAYREQAARLSDLAELLSGSGQATSVSSARLPMDEVRERLSSRPNFFMALDEAAEDFHRRLDPGEDLGGAVRNWLRAEHGIIVRTLPISAMPNLRRRYDRHSMRLFLSERLGPAELVREMAQEACQIALRKELSEELAALKLSSAESNRIARFDLARYAALALIMPYGAFLAAAQKSRYDIGVLSARFRVSFEQAAQRLTSLQKTGHSGVPFFMQEIDIAGNIIRKAGATGFPQARFGGSCPKLGVYAAFASPGSILVERVELPDEGRYLVVSRTLEGLLGQFGERPRQTAIMIGCDAEYASQIIYGRYAEAQPLLEAGRACRLCERTGCLARAEAPVTRPLGLDEMVAGLSVFDFQ